MNVDNTGILEGSISTEISNNQISWKNGLKFKISNERLKSVAPQTLTCKPYDFLKLLETPVCY